MSARTVVQATEVASLPIPRPGPRLRAPTLVACPAPPARGSYGPPESAIARVARAARQYDAHPVVVGEPADDSLELDDDDILEVTTTIDPVDEILGRTGVLARARSTWQAADVVASALARALGARAVIVHTMSPDATSSRIIGVHGARTQDLLGSTEAGPDDVVLGTLRGTGKVATMRFQAHRLPRAIPARFRLVGATAALVAFPVMIGSSWLGVVEVVDPNRVDDRALRQGRAIATRFSEYLSTRNAAAA
jgi:hypothetical protein